MHLAEPLGEGNAIHTSMITFCFGRPAISLNRGPVFLLSAQGRGRPGGKEDGVKQHGIADQGHKGE